MSEELLHDLNPAQRAAVTSEAAPLVILAGAGSGKTRVLTRRIAYRCAVGTAEAPRVLALTFTRKAAGELGERLKHLGLRDRVTAGTFHAVAYAQLRSRWSERNERAPDLLERKARLIARLIGRTKRVQPADVAGEIEWAKARLITPDRYAEAAVAAARRPPVEPDAMATLYERYETEKRRQRQVDFDDLLWRCIHAVETDTEFGAAQRWRFRHLFVDEFQDVNPLQFRLLKAWQGGSHDLCVVGDPSQAIYGWNGAEPGYLVDAGRHLGAAETIALEHNYRSTPQIVATANVVLGTTKGRLWLRATRPDGPIPTIHSYASDRHEARAVARAVTDRHGPGTPWSHQAVLVRTNAQSVLFAEAFRAAKIPFRLRGQAAFLELPEVKSTLIAWRRERPEFRAAMGALETEIAATRGDTDSAETLLLADAEATRLRNLEELLRLASEYEAIDRRATVDGFGAWLTATVGGDESGNRSTNVVEIATFHAAKGLEWPIVHAAGLETGLVPIMHAKTSAAIEEERRLFYVVVTRAERELRLSWSEERLFDLRPVKRRRSPYLDELEPIFDALAAGTAPSDVGQSLSAVRQTLNTKRGGKPRGKADLEPADADLFEALRAWRSTQAKAANVPAYVVFDDKTLTAIAMTRPADQKQLLRVSGVGPVKAGRFGAEVLTIVRDHGST